MSFNKIILKRHTAQKEGEKLPGNDYKKVLLRCFEYRNINGRL